MESPAAPAASAVAAAAAAESSGLPPLEKRVRLGEQFQARVPESLPGGWGGGLVFSRLASRVSLLSPVASLSPPAFPGVWRGVSSLTAGGASDPARLRPLPDHLKHSRLVWDPYHCPLSEAQRAWLASTAADP